MITSAVAHDIVDAIASEMGSQVEGYYWDRFKGYLQAHDNVGWMGDLNNFSSKKACTILRDEKGGPAGLIWKHISASKHLSVVHFLLIEPRPNTE